MAWSATSASHVQLSRRGRWNDEYACCEWMVKRKIGNKSMHDIKRESVATASKGTRRLRIRDEKRRRWVAETTKMERRGDVQEQERTKR
jgi:hypothetical protein